MTLYHDLAVRFGIDTNTYPDEFVALCPCHPDQTPSLVITKKGDKVLYHCRAGCGTAVLAPALGMVSDDRARVYLASRGLGNISLSSFGDLKIIPTGLVARLRDSSGVLTGGRLFLNLTAAGAKTDNPRKYSGKSKCSGYAVHLGMPITDGCTLYVAEGLETALSVHVMTGGVAPVWAALSAGSLAKQNIPKHVGRVIVVADNDPSRTGVNAAYTLSAQSPVPCEVWIPKTVGHDANDVLQAGGVLSQQWFDITSAPSTQNFEAPPIYRTAVCLAPDFSLPAAVRDRIIDQINTNPNELIAKMWAGDTTVLLVIARAVLSGDAAALQLAVDALNSAAAVQSAKYNVGKLTQYMYRMVIADLNQKTCLIENDAGSATVLQFNEAAPDFDLHYKLQEFRSVHNLKSVACGIVYDTKEEVFVPQLQKAKAADLWLGAGALMNSYPVFVFDPSSRGGVVSGKNGAPVGWNKWRGLACHPKNDADWSDVRWFIEQQICGGATDMYNYVYDLLAKKIQQPGWLPGAAIFLYDPVGGTGKTLFGKILETIIGSHHTFCTSWKGGAGVHFAPELAESVLVISNEFSADQHAFNRLKALITDTSIMVERKYKERRKVTNRCLFVLDSNQTPQLDSSNDRRFFVVTPQPKTDFSTTRMVNMGAELAKHGAGWVQLRGFMSFLLARNVENFNASVIPTTETKKTVQTTNLPDIVQWWNDCLVHGCVQVGRDSVVQLVEDAQSPRVKLPTKTLQQSYMYFREINGLRNGKAVSCSNFVPALKELCIDPEWYTQSRIDGAPQRCVVLSSISEANNYFYAKYPSLNEDAPLTLDPTPPTKPTKPRKPKLVTQDIIPDVDYTLVTDIVEVQTAIAGLMAANKPIALDTETTSLAPWQDSGEVRLVQLSNGDSTYVIDVRSCGGLEALKPVLYTIPSPVLHNATFDMRWLDGLQQPHDTMLAERALSGLTAENPKASLTLADAVSRRLGIAIDKKQQKSDWKAEILTQSQLAYAAQDAQITAKLWAAQRELLRQHDYKTIYLLMRSAITPTSVMVNSGITIDTVAHSAAIAAREAEIKALHAGLQARNAPAKLKTNEGQAWLSLRLGSKAAAWSKTASGKFKTGAAELEAHADIFGDPDLLAIYTKLADLESLDSKFGTKFMTEYVGSDGRAHTNLRIGGAITGRYTSSEPSMQNLPRSGTERALFRAAEGNVFVLADYGQIELRVAALVAGENKLLQAFATGDDPHILTASLVLHKPVTEVTKSERQMAKAVNFGLLYGQAARGLVKYAAQSYGVTMTLEQAERFRTAWFDAYPAIKRYHDQRTVDASSYSTKPLIRTSMGGNKWVWSPAHTGAMGALNYPIQGGAAEGMYAALANICEKLKPVQAHPVLVIHDELVVECPENHAEAVTKIVIDTMIEGMVKIFPNMPTTNLVEACVSPSLKKG